MEREHPWQAPFDFLTLVLIVAAGFELGFQGLFGVSVAGRIFGAWRYIIYDLAGVAAAWQLYRQRFF
jgi:uncharacterized membrane protein YuzA (DUF378 family)